jgi:putative membrane protein
MQTSDEHTLLHASFNPKVRTYWLLSGALVLVATVVGIVLLPLWFIIGHKVTDWYLKRLTCELTDRSLKVGKGLFVRVEKTVPLDKITDLGLVQGPIMRYLGIEQLTVETAGQSSQGALVRLVGVENGRSFRDSVLRQRDLVVATGSVESPVSDGPMATETATILQEIRDGILRIESLIASKP